ncbi:DUF3306 domain-containing protein [Salipiger bermudensis]|uniref:DUF3306 domain-containing protein n=1 Tax=Salipiger bermudensis (strain DSM 26914 / JCM 13377 / KCTC 12554 / HTCC2601) TaxID=314265 RepID=Q0FS85_SALBH|nr:DUF3306 domain-containing protein [Salipiger bermudensis]EAU47116.1 hypothetical protein R2601_05093 [Salipiger bermudensis HTCC2601]
MRDFWSRRKAAVEAEQKAEADAQLETQRAEEEAKLAERSDEELLAEAGLPLPEDITDGEMVQKFLKSQLPKRLKNRALRTLWRSNPVLACLDGLNDYDTDFTFVTPAADFKTTYQVGKGLLAHLDYVAKDAVENEAAESASEEAPELAAETTSLRAPETLGPTIETKPEIPPLEVPAAETAAPETAQTDTPPEEEESMLPASARRMRFHFEAS